MPGRFATGRPWTSLLSSTGMALREDPAGEGRRGSPATIVTPVGATPFRVAVVGGRGKTGRSLDAALRLRGVDVIVVGRAEWTSLGQVLDGADALYVIAPNFHPDEPAYVGEVLDAARGVGIGRVGYHSVASPFVPAMPHHLGKARGENVVRTSGLAWTILQPCAYVQNLLPGLRADPPGIRLPYDLDLPHALVDLDDIAACAAAVLVGDGHVGATYELGGRPVTMRSVAASASAVLGRHVASERLDPAAWERGAGAGLDERERAGLRAMFDYYDAHGFLAGSRVTGLLLGRPARTLDEVLRRELAQPTPGHATGARAE